jgi:hypothetical protein
VEKYGTARQATDDNIIRHMRFACPITKARDTHSEYVTLNAFALQQWLRERASMLLLYVHCLYYSMLNVAAYKLTAGLNEFSIVSMSRMTCPSDFSVIQLQVVPLCTPRRQTGGVQM